MKRGIMISFMCLVVVGTMIVGISSTGQPQTKPPIKIGIAFDLTGVVGEAGRTQRDTALLAIEEFNKAGGVNGRMIESMVMDDQSSPERATSAAKRFLSAGVSMIFCGSTSTTSLAALRANTTSAKPIPQMGHACTKALFENPWWFGTYPSNDWLVRSFQNQLKKGGHSKVGILYTTLAWPKDLLDLFQKDAEAKGFKIVGIEACDAGATDVTPQVTKLAKMNPDCIVTLAYPVEFAAYRRAYLAQGLKIPDYHLGAYIEVVMKTADPKLMEGAYGLSVYNPANTVFQGKLARFVQKYGYNPPESYFAMGYDGASLMLAGLKVTPDPDNPDSIKTTCETKLGEFKITMGDPGQKCMWTSGDHSPLQICSFYRIKGGKPVW